MKVTLSMSGGWTNIKLGCTVDTVSLPKDTADALEQALANEELFRRHPATPDARDARTFVIEVERTNGTMRTSFSEAAIPDLALPVLAILRPLSRIIPSE